MKINVKAPLQLSDSVFATSSASESTTAAATHNDKAPGCPPVAFASLIEAIYDAKNVGYDWTQDEYIGEQMSRCFTLSPELKAFLSQKTNLPLAEVQDGRSHISATALTGTPLTKQERVHLADVLEECFLDTLAEPGVAEPFGDGEAEKLEQLKQDFNQKITELQAEESDSIGKEWKTLLVAETAQGDNTEAGATQGPLPKEVLDMLKEFRELKGKNHAHLVVDNKALEDNIAQLSVLAERGGQNLTNQTAVALRALCQNILDKVPAETGDHKLWMREVISSVSALSAALQVADKALSHVHDYQVSEKKGGQPQLPGEVNEAKANLKRAWQGMKNTVELLGQVSDFGWMLDFKGAIKGHFATLEVMCPAVINALKRERTALLQDTEVEKARLAIETDKLSSLEKSTDSSVIRDVAYALKHCCTLATKALNQPLPDHKDMKKTAAALFDVSDTLQTAEFTMNAARQLPASGADKALMDYAAALLEKQVKILNKAVNNLGACAQPLEFDPDITQRFTPAEKALNDLGVAVRLESKTLLQMGNELRNVKHTLKPAKSAPEVVLKKWGEGVEYSTLCLTKTLNGARHMVRLTGQALGQGSRHMIHKGGQQAGRTEDDEKQSANALLRATARGPCGSIKTFRIQTEQFMAAINKLEKPDGARSRDPRDGVLSRGQNKNAPGTTKAERLTEKLTTLMMPHAAIQAAQQQLIAEAEKTETDLDMMAERYPQYTKAIHRFRMRLRESVSLCQEVNNICHRAMENLGRVKIPDADRVAHLRNGINQVEQATEASIKAAERVRGLPAEVRTTLENALQRASAAVSQVVVHLSAKTPDQADVNVALEKAKTALHASELMAGSMADEAGVNLGKARQALAEVSERANTKKLDEAAAPLLAGKQPDKKEIRQTLKTMADAVYSVANAAGKLESEITRITGRRLDVFSTDERIIKHLAGLLAGQSGAVLDKLSPAAQEIHQRGIDETIKKIAGYFRKPGDATGHAFALRLQKEYQRACAGTMAMPQSIKDVMGKHQSWQEHLVNSGAKGVQSRAVYMMAHQALEVALNTALPAMSLATGARALAKLVMTPVTLAIALGELDKTVMPGHALPLGAKSDLIKSQLATAANRAVQVFLPSIVKLAKDVALTGGQVWRDGAETVLNKTKERLPEDVIMAAAGMAFSSGMNIVNGVLSEKAANNTMTSDNPPVTSSDITKSTSANSSGSVTTEEVRGRKVKRSMGNNQLSVEESPPLIIPESDTVAMRSYASTKYDRMKSGLSSDEILSVNDERKIKEMYGIGYPHNMNINLQMNVSLTEIFVEKGETRLKPDSMVEFDVYHMSADGTLVKKDPLLQRGTLLDLARGKYYAPNEEIRVRDLPGTLYNLYHVTPYIGGPTPPINALLEEKLKGKLQDFDRTEPTVFREKIWGGKVNNTLCNLYEKERIPELKEVIEGRRQPSSILLERSSIFDSKPIDIGGVFSIRKDNGDMILVSVLQQKTVTISLNKEYTPEEAEGLRNFLLPHFDLSQNQRLSGSVYKNAFTTKLCSDKSYQPFLGPVKNIFRSPLHFTPMNSIKSMGEYLALLENRDMKSNVDFLLTTNGEAWAKELIHQGQRLVNGVMLATVMAPTVWGYSLLNLGLSMASYGLSAAEIAQEDDASKLYQLKQGLFMDVILSTPGDIVDATTVLSQFKRMCGMPKATASISLSSGPVPGHQGPVPPRTNLEPGPPHMAPTTGMNLQGFEQPPTPTISQFEQYAKPDNVNYRRPENKIGEGKLGCVYLIDDHQVMKDYRPQKIPRTADLNYEEAYQSAQNNVDAFKLLYGDDSATVYRYLEDGKQKITVKMKQLEGETLYSLSLPTGKYSASQVSDLFNHFRKGDIDKLIDDFVNDLAEKGIVYNDFALSNFIYDVDRKKLSAIDFDEAVVKPTREVVTDAEKTKMRAGLTELFSRFKGDVDINRLKMLQDHEELVAARGRFDENIDKLLVDNASDIYKNLAPRQQDAYDKFKQGYNSITDCDRKSLKEVKKEVGQLLGPALEKKIKKMSEKELIAFFNDPGKYKSSLDWQQKGILSRYIQKVGKKNRVEEVIQTIHDSAYQNTRVKGLKRKLFPQQLVITAADVESKGRCLPMVLINEVGHATGQMKQLEKNYQRIIDRVDVSQSKIYMQGMDNLHVQLIDPRIVSVLDNINVPGTIKPLRTITEMVDEAAQSSVSKSFLVSSANHVMSIGVKIGENNKKTYHFQEPNIGWLEFKDAGSLKEYMEKTIGDKRYAEHFGADFNGVNPNDARYRFADIDLDKLKDVKVDGMGDVTIADFSAAKTITSVHTVNISGKVHQVSPGEATADNLLEYMLGLEQSLYSIKRPDVLTRDGSISIGDSEFVNFLNNLIRHKVKVFIDIERTGTASTAPTAFLKEELNRQGITYITRGSSSYDFFMNEDYHYPTGDEHTDARILANLNKMVMLVNQRSTMNRQENIMVCDSSGNGISGILKSAIEIRRLLDERPDEFGQEISDQKPSAEITTVIANDFSVVNSQDNAAYRVTQQAINNVREEHPTAVERPSDVALLNAYAEDQLAQNQQTNQRVRQLQVESSQIDGQQPPTLLSTYQTKSGETGLMIIERYNLDIGSVYLDNSEVFRGHALDAPIPVGTTLKLRIPQDQVSSQISGQQPPTSWSTYQTQSGETGLMIVERYQLDIGSVYLDNSEIFRGHPLNAPIPVGTTLKLRIPQDQVSSQM